MQLVLASASEGRKYLLKLLKIPFEIIHTHLDEEKIIDKNPLQTIQLRARLKGEEVVASGLQRSSHKSLKLLRSLKGENFLILSADTEVILNDKLIGKPKDYDDAVRMLKMLSGKTHEVISAYYIIRHSGERSDSRIDFGQARMTFRIWQGYDRSLVIFRKLTNEDIRIYLSLTEYTRYTGSYALIASPQNFITKIEGSISNVIGLPLEKIIPIFAKIHILIF